jgi:hypothetical protein
MTSPASLLPCCRADLVVRPLGEDGPYEAGLLTGTAGIALALLAATTAVEPAWDRMLLVAIPPRYDD